MSRQHMMMVQAKVVAVRGLWRHRGQKAQKEKRTEVTKKFHAGTKQPDFQSMARAQVED